MKIELIFINLSVIAWKVGERIRVILDCDDNTLAFERNYEFLGVAFRGKSTYSYSTYRSVGAKIIYRGMKKISNTAFHCLGLGPSVAHPASVGSGSDQLSGSDSGSDHKKS